VEGRAERAGTERGEGDEVADAAAPSAVQRARGAAIAELHADPEQEGAQQHGKARGRERADDRSIQADDSGEHGREQQRGEAEHQQLRLDVRHVAAENRTPVARGEAKARGEQGGAERPADQKQERDPGGSGREPGSAEAESGKGEQEGAALEGEGGGQRTHCSRKSLLGGYQRLPHIPAGRSRGRT
jgi:hypothetical protein